MRILIATLLTVFLAVGGCSGETAHDTPTDSPAPGEELFCAADSREQAEEIASVYRITLVSYEWGIATFHTDEDPKSVIERGRENGWIELNLNIEKQIVG